VLLRASDSLLCQLIVEATHAKDLKIARFAFDVLRALEDRRLAAMCHDFDRCITYLAIQRILLTRGNTSRWRFSEVRLLQPPIGPLNFETSRPEDDKTEVPENWRQEWSQRLLYDV
jgi:hypothetical protein